MLLFLLLFSSSATASFVMSHEEYCDDMFHVIPFYVMQARQLGYDFEYLMEFAEVFDPPDDVNFEIMVSRAFKIPRYNSVQKQLFATLLFANQHYEFCS
jgi:hypothetical protein